MLVKGGTFGTSNCSSHRSYRNISIQMSTNHSGYYLQWYPREGYVGRNAYISRADFPRGLRLTVVRVD